MRTPRRKQITGLISSLLLPSYSEGSISLEDHVKVLTEAVDADACGILQIPGGNSLTRILSGCGLQIPEDRWPEQVPSPHLSRHAFRFDQVRAVTLKGPFEGDLFLEAEEARTVLFMPAVMGDECLASIALRRTEDRFSRGEVERFTAVAGVINVAQHLKRSLKDHSSQQGTDLGTELGLFSDFHGSMVQELSRARRGGGWVTMGIMSVVSGEPDLVDGAVLEVARTLKEKLRNFDTIDRYSSSELAFILPELRGAEGIRVVERVVGEIIASLRGRDSAPDIYIGLSCYPEDGASVERLIETAEAAINQAVEAGVPGVYRWEE